MSWKKNNQMAHFSLQQHTPFLQGVPSVHWNITIYTIKSEHFYFFFWISLITRNIAVIILDSLVTLAQHISSAVFCALSHCRLLKYSITSIKLIFSITFLLLNRLTNIDHKAHLKGLISTCCKKRKRKKKSIIIATTNWQEEEILCFPAKFLNEKDWTCSDIHTDISIGKGSKSPKSKTSATITKVK